MGTGMPLNTQQIAAIAQTILPAPKVTATRHNRLRSFFVLRGGTEFDNHLKLFRTCVISKSSSKSHGLITEPSLRKRSYRK